MYHDFFMSALANIEEDYLYDLAKKMRDQAFLIIRPDAESVPEEFLGESVEITDMFFPKNAKEPLFEISGFNGVIPMSDFTCAC